MFEKSDIFNFTVFEKELFATSYYQTREEAVMKLGNIVAAGKKRGLKLAYRAVEMKPLSLEGTYWLGFIIKTVPTESELMKHRAEVAKRPKVDEDVDVYEDMDDDEE